MAASVSTLRYRAVPVRAGDIFTEATSKAGCAASTPIPANTNAIATSLIGDIIVLSGRAYNRTFVQPGSRIDLRLIAGVLLLAAAAFFTWKTIDGLAARRQLRMELAELGHVRYGVLNADQWVERLVPILDAQIDGLDLTASNSASLKPTVEQALYRLLDSVKEQMTAKPAANPQPAE